MVVNNYSVGVTVGSSEGGSRLTSAMMLGSGANFFGAPWIVFENNCSFLEHGKEKEGLPG